MPTSIRIEGLAIVSSNGMIADSNCVMPNSLKLEADQEFFETSLDAAALLVHGRKSHEGQANSHNRRRLLLTPGAPALSEVLAQPGPLCALSGPEGGLDPGEQQAAMAAGFEAVGLGPRVLRADTAPIALLAWMAAFEN